MDELLGAGKHAHVVALLEAAIIHEQTQPWMYEALAASMEVIGRPQAEIERVVLSLADFGTTDFGTLSYSAAYLVRLGREAAGLKLYREASRLLPEQPEPYLLGLRLARKLKDVDGIEWAASGVLQHVWQRGYPALHREAENAAAEALQSLEKSGQSARAEQFRQALALARRRDLSIRLVWSGEGDLDLLVEEPARSICSFQNPETPGGGVLVHDGHGPDQANCYEEYVCPSAQAGLYQVTVRHVWGAIVSNRATLTIIRAQGTPEEQVETRHIVLAPDLAPIRVTLESGRRKQLRNVAPREVQVPTTASPLPAHRPGKPKVQRALAEFAGSRRELEGMKIRQVGAVGFQPIIQVIPDGATFSARAVVSPDRRYVRIGVNPVFSNVTDVFTFSFLGGSLGNAPPGSPAGN